MSLSGNDNLFCLIRILIKNSTMEIIIGLIVGFLYFGLKYVVKKGKKEKCPKCEKWFSLKLVKSTMTGQTATQKSESYKEETGEFEVKTVRDKTIVKPIFKTRQRVVPATKYHYKNTFTCKYCSNQLVTQSYEVL